MFICLLFIHSFVHSFHIQFIHS